MLVWAILLKGMERVTCSLEGAASWVILERSPQAVDTSNAARKKYLIGKFSIVWNPCRKDY